MKKYWLANGLKISEEANQELQTKEGQALFFLSAATLPFLIYVILFDFAFKTSPFEYVSYVLLLIYNLFLFLNSWFNKKFRSNLRSWIVYALPFAGFVQYLNMYISGPNLANMILTIVVIVFGSVIIKRNLEVLVLAVFSIAATALIVFLRRDLPLHQSYAAGVLECLVFIGVAQYFRNHHLQVQDYRTKILANSLNVWDHLIGNANIVMALLDLKGVVVEINENSDIYSREKVLGQEFMSLLAVDQGRVFAAALNAVQQSKKATSCKITMIGSRKNLLRLAITLWPIMEGEEVVAVMSFALDVSAEELAEQKRLQSAQMNILGEISATIAHEIRNPLTVISGNTEVMILQINKQNEGKQFLPRLEKIRQMTERIVTITKNVRRMYHSGESEPFQECLVADIIGDATSFCSHKCQDSEIALEVIQDNKQLVIHGKPLMLSQAILNLMHNSIDAAREFNDKWIKIVVTDKENEVQISVIDSGRGISDEILKHIGQPFYTTKSAGNGNGLGINLARRVIEGHGGVFRYDPEHAHTKFDLCLPKNRAG